MRTKWLWIVVALQVAWIGGVSAVQEVRLRTGFAVRLATLPVDPRDLLRGDYITLRYGVGTLGAPLFPAGLPPSTAAGSRVWVRLGRANDVHVAREASLAPLTGTPSEPVIAGTITSVGASEAEVDFGLSRFYVREGTGNPRGKLVADVVVSPSGEPRLRDLLVDGVPYARAMSGVGR